MLPHVHTALPQGSAAGSSERQLQTSPLGHPTETPVSQEHLHCVRSKSLNPVSHLWQRPQMDTEGRERTRQAYMILPSGTSPSVLSLCLQLFSGQGIFWAGRVSPYLGSSMDFSTSYFSSFLLGPERVLASTTSFSNSLPRCGTHSIRTTSFCSEPDCYYCCLMYLFWNRHRMVDPYPYLSMPLLSLHICIIFLASCLFSTLQASSLCSNSSSQSHSLPSFILVAPPLILFQLYYVLFKMRGPELHRWEETMDLCHSMAMFAVLLSMPFLIIPNT